MIPNLDDGRNRRWWIKAAAVTVLVVALAVGTYFVVRPKPDQQAGQIVGFTPPPTPTGSVAPAPPLKVVVLHGGTTGCQPSGVGCGGSNYANLLAGKENWILTNLALGGNGYVAGSTTSPPSDYASDLPLVYKAKPDLVIVEGSVTDRYFPAATVQLAAESLYASIKKQLPKVTLVVVGPAWAGTPPASVVATENALAAAAKGRAMFINPLTEQWFSGKNASLMASDGRTPTSQGHVWIATMLQTDLAGLKLQAAT